MEKKYIFYWLDGSTTESSGNSVSDAFHRAGYGGNALQALDYFKEVTPNPEIIYDGYFYDSAKDLCESDCNELWLGDTYISRITSVRDASRIEDLGTVSDTETCILIIPRHLESAYHVRNINMCPEVCE